MRSFNTTGPCRADVNYMLPASERLPEARPIIAEQGYFVVHAPRQTGKTTALMALTRELTAEGSHAALHVSCEAGQAAGDDYAAAEQIVLDAIRSAAALDLPHELAPGSDALQSGAGSRLSEFLRAWAQACPRPLVLVLDEIDALRGQSLISVLRQLRAGFPSRPTAFPSSIILCGMRDVRDYKAASGGDPSRLGTSSPFNIKLESLRLGDFSEAELRALYAQHTRETGQIFTEEALAHAWQLSQGQPWLVNALAREVIAKLGLTPSDPITDDHFDTAKERLILARQTHIDSLVARLNEARVRRFVEPLLAGTLDLPWDDAFDDDLLYARDLGLIARTNPVRVANPIYHEVIARVLTSSAEARVLLDPRSFVRPDGTLDLPKILAEFAAFWREHGDVLTGSMPYHEVAPQLVLMAYLQRVVNGGGFVEREYGLGRGRIDLLVRWPLRPHPQPLSIDGEGGSACPSWQREALELKVWAPGKPDPLAKGLVQLDGYLASLGLDEGVLVLFDRRPEAPPWEERVTFAQATTPGGRKVTVLRA